MRTAPDINLSVTRTIIDKSLKASASYCMIAMSLREWAKKTDREVWSIFVTSETISYNLGPIDEDPTRFQYPTPPKAVLSLKAFDQGEEVQPFVLRLPGKSAFARPVNKRQPRGTYKAREKKKRTGTTLRRCTRRWAGLSTIEGKKPPHLKKKG